MPRPPEMTVSASVSSGKPVETSSRRSTSFMRAVAGFTLAFSTCAVFATDASAGLNTLGRSVAIHGVFAHVIFASSLPAYTGRVATSVSPSIVNPTESAERPAPRRAANRAAISRMRLVTGAKTAFGDSLAMSSASAGTQTSPMYGANAAFSSTQTLLAPQLPSCLMPSSLALSVSHTASTLPPDSRPASPSTSLITFFGAPFRSSSTMHQYAFAMSDRLRILAQGANELFDRVFHVALDDAPRRPCGQRLQRFHGELRRTGCEPEVARLHVFDLLLLGAHDAFQRGIARLVESLLRREHRGQWNVEELEAALHLTADADRFGLRVDGLLHDPGRAWPVEHFGELGAHGAHVVVDGLPTAEHERGLLLLDDGRQRLRRGQRVRVGPRRIVEVDGAVAAHRQRGAQRLFHAIGTERHRDDLALSALFLDAQRLFDGEFVVWRDDPRDPGGVDGLRIAADLHLGGGVRDLLDGDDDLHELAPRSDCS